MITKSKQVWAVGATVKVGFLSNLLVVAAIHTPGDYAPDAYILTRNGQLYSFVPHNGLTKIDFEEAQQMIADSNVYSAKCAAAAITKADMAARNSALINSLITA